MAHINEQAASDGVRMGMQLMGEALKGDINTEEVARQNALGAFIVRDVLPAKDLVDDPHDLVRMVQAKGTELGIESLQSMKVFANIFKAGDMMEERAGGGTKDMLKQYRQEVAFVRDSLKLTEELKSPEEKEVDELRKKTTFKRQDDLIAIHNIALKYLDEGDLIERVDDMASDLDSALKIDLPGYIFQGSEIKTIENLVKYLASELKKKEEFRIYEITDLETELSRIINNPKGRSADQAYKALVKPRPKGDVVSEGAMAEVGRILGGQGQ